MKTLLILRFFHYIWFIDSENLYFILILKEKMTRFWHLILVISLTVKYFQKFISKFCKRRGHLWEEIWYRILKYCCQIRYKHLQMLTREQNFNWIRRDFSFRTNLTKFMFWTKYRTMSMLDLRSTPFKFLECKFSSKSGKVLNLGPICLKIRMSNSYWAPLNWLVWKFPSNCDKILILGQFSPKFWI